MTRRRWLVVAGVLVLMVAAAIVRNQLKVRSGRLARAEQKQQLHPVRSESAEVTGHRQALFDLLRPVNLANCTLQRFGETHDGGYLMCANLLDAVETAYSYGIGGYDQWGCDMSKALDVPVHQYDCFDLRRPACYLGDTTVHNECVAANASTVEGRVFDTVANQMSRNGDQARTVVLKMDVEGSEWETLLGLPDDVLGRVDQMAVEFHWEETADHRWVHDPRHLDVIRRLRQYFEVVNIHFNNASCIGDLAPFPAFAYEVLFVSKRLAVVDARPHAGGAHPLDAVNNSTLADCQSVAR